MSLIFLRYKCKFMHGLFMHIFTSVLPMPALHSLHAWCLNILRKILGWCRQYSTCTMYVHTYNSWTNMHGFYTPLALAWANSQEFACWLFRKTKRLFNCLKQQTVKCIEWTTPRTYCCIFNNYSITGKVNFDSFFLQDTSMRYTRRVLWIRIRI